jgi:major membrane immunogen (membrane-anchored lipoprotein)
MFFRSVFLILLVVGASCSSSKSTTNVVRDGNSLEKAIIVKSIAEEYEYVRKVCPDCELQMQMLIFDKKKPYDVLEVKTSDGETVKYVFDISKFYGKRSLFRGGVF